MTYASKRWNRMVWWCQDNPAELYADYRDELPLEMAQHILAGEFDKFWEEFWEIELNASDWPGFWDHWEEAFASEFGYDAFGDMPASVQEIAFENRWIDSRDYVRTVCRNTSVRVNAVLKKRSGELIYGPDLSAWSRDEYERTRYLQRAFGFDGRPESIASRLEIVYGGYDRECAVVIGTVDLWEILESGKAPSRITVGPDDSDNLLFYEFWNGCGNMGGLPIQKTRTFPASFHVDGARGYGVDACYGFTGSVWAHGLRVA